MRQLKTSKSDELWRKMKKCENGKAVKLKQRKKNMKNLNITQNQEKL